MSSFSSNESAYGSTGEVEEPVLWLNKERICDGVLRWRDSWHSVDLSDRYSSTVISAFVKKRP